MRLLVNRLVLNLLLGVGIGRRRVCVGLACAECGAKKSATSNKTCFNGILHGTNCVGCALGAGVGKLRRQSGELK